MEQVDLAEDVWGSHTASNWKRAFHLASRLTSLELGDSFLNEVIDSLVELSCAERGFLLLREGPEGRVVAARNSQGEDIREAAGELSWTIASQVLIKGEPIVSVDARSDERFSASDSVNKLKLKSICCLPLKTTHGEIVAAVYFDNRSVNNAFTSSRMDVLEAFCKLAGQALLNQRTLSYLKANGERLAENCRRLIDDKSRLRGEKLKLSTSHALIVLLTLGSLLWNGCGQMSTDFLLDSPYMDYNPRDRSLSDFGSIPEDEETVKTQDTILSAATSDEPVPIFGDVHQLNLYASAIISEDLLDSLGLEELQLSLSAIVLVAENSEEDVIITMDPPLEVSLIEGGALIDAPIVSLEISEVAYTGIEVEVIDFYASGTLEDETSYTYYRQDEGTLTFDSTWTLDEEGAARGTLSLDYNSVMTGIKERVDKQKGKNPKEKLIEIEEHEDEDSDDIWGHIERRERFEMREEEQEAREEQKEEEQEARSMKQEEKQEVKKEEKEAKQEAKEVKQEVKQEIKEEKKEVKQEAKEEKQEVKQEIKEEKKEAKQEAKEVKQEVKQEIKEEKKEAKQEAKEVKQEKKKKGGK